MCLFCNSVIYLSNMGKQALISHMKSKRHQGVKKSQEISHALNFSFQTIPSNMNPPVAETAVSETELVTSTEVLGLRKLETCNKDLSSFLSGQNVAKAEIMWCLFTVAQHTSFRTSANGTKLFSLMFPDSEIAKKMSLQRTKLSYIVVHGLAPYFSLKLLNTLKECSHIVVGFDESLNKVAQKQQMDISIRFWHPNKKQVSTQYLTSEFLGHTCATDLVDSFMKAISPVGIEKLVQVSMDGPNVNLKFLRDLNDNICGTSPIHPKLLDLGTCGLHTINCAFKSAIRETDWKIVKFLKSAYYLFKDVPARRADYTHYSGSTLFPKKFCYIRWIENSDVAMRALTILPHMYKFIECAIEHKKTYCSCNNFKIVSECLKENLFGAKLAFFQSLAACIEPFLTEFQSDEPLAPFLYESVTSIALSILQRFVKPCILEKNALNLIKINVFEKNNLLSASEVTLSFAVKEELRKIKKKKDIDILKMRQSILRAYQMFVHKLFERSPLRFKLTRAISFLDPQVFIQTDLASERLSACLEILVSTKWVSGLKADKIHQEFQNLFNESSVVSLMKSYKRSETRLDNFWTSILDLDSKSNDLTNFVKLLLILSHGNAFLERGFSINSECIINNQTEESLVALRQVHEAIQNAGGIEKINITKAMIQSVKGAHFRYSERMAKKKEEEKYIKEVEDSRKRVIAELKTLEQKKIKVMTDAHKEAALIEEKIKILRK